MTAKGQAKPLKDLTRAEALDVIEFMTQEIDGLRAQVEKCKQDHGPFLAPGKVGNVP
jgi:hypothetical protein